MSEPHRVGSIESKKAGSVDSRKTSLSARAARFLHFDNVAWSGEGSHRHGSNAAALAEKQRLNAIGEHSQDGDHVSSDRKASIERQAVIENADRRRDVQTLPPWIHSLQQGENMQEFEQQQGLMYSPPRAKVPQHNHMPHPKYGQKGQPSRGKAWDHARSGEAFTMPFASQNSESRWAAFVRSSAYPQPSSEEGDLVSEDWVRENVPDMSEPWMPAMMVDQTEKEKGIWLFSNDKRTATMNTFQRTLMKNPFIPLVIRLTVMAFCLAALGLGVTIYERSSELNNHHHIDGSKSNIKSICKQQTSTYMAFIVDAIAVVYLFFITYDEYFSKPLGQRRSRDKMRLLFLDLLFITFSAANLSLAFDTMTDRQWSCHDTPNLLKSEKIDAARSTCVANDTLCNRQKALVSVLLVAEVAWVLTFTISVLRVVERVQR